MQRFGEAILAERTLLIIGAGYEQVRAYELAKEMGLFVIGTDMNPMAPAFEVADHSLICSTRDIEETLAVIGRFSQERRIDGVMTVANDVPLTVAEVAELLNLSGIPVEVAILASNKLLMKERFLASDVGTPFYVAIESKAQLLKGVSEMHKPVVLKPSDGRGSRGVLYIENDTDLNWAWEKSIASSENKILMLEEYVEGSQLSVEGLFLDGKYVPIAFADRNYDNINQTKPFVVEDGGIIPSKYEGDILNEISDLTENAAKSLGIEWGPVKGDIVLNDKGPQIIELAARLSGNYLATHHIPMAYGVDIVSAMISLALGENVDPGLLRPKHKKYLGVRYFFPPPGRIKGILGVDKVKSLNYVKLLDIYRKVGDIQEPILCHADRAGTIICQADNYQLAKQRVEKTTSNIVFIV